MADAVALNEVVRVLGTELGKKDERVLIGSTEEEKEVLQKHASIGKQRAVVGFIGGSAICAGLWKALGGQRRLLGGLTMASGGMAGFMYGILSIRRDLFVDILTLPDEKSPFAKRSREILDKALPTNAFYMEVKEIFKRQHNDSGSWDSVPAFLSLTAPAHDNKSTDAGFRGFDSDASRLPRLPPLPKADDDAQFLKDDNAVTSSASPFFFGTPQSSQPSESSSPYSYDYYDSQRAKPAPPKTKTEDEDDDYYYGGWNQSEENKPKPTTWEELRRRAAANGK